MNQWPQTADLVITTYKIWTGCASKPWAEGVAACCGRIIAVGSRDEIQQLIGPKTQVLALENALVLPGFIDNHVHFVTGGFELLSVDLRDAKSPAEFTRRIQTKANNLPPGTWITGGSWDHQLWAEVRLPEKEWVDPVTPAHPIFVTRLDLHMGLANSLALQLAGITADTPDPDGGVIIKDPITGQPTGILKDAAMDLVMRVMPQKTKDNMGQALRVAMQHANSLGITSVQDVTDWGDWDLYQECRHKGELSLRIAARTPIPSWKKQYQMIQDQGKGDEWLKLSGVKGFVDGSLGSSTAYFFEPYLDSPDHRGLLHDQMFPPGQLLAQIRDADKHGLQCSIHAIGDQANHLLIDMFEDTVRENGVRDRRLRIEHAQHLIPADIRRIAAAQIIASVHPYHLSDDGRWAEGRIGKDRCQDAFPLRQLVDAGATVTFGTDWPVAPLNPLLTIYAAVTRRTLDGKHPDGWIPAHKVCLEEAVRAYTTAGAYAEFAENEKGSIEIGKLADMVILSRDIFAADPAQLPETKVLYTIVNGQIVYENR